MIIHHSTVKKAEKLGIALEEVGDGESVRALWPKRAVAFIGSSAADAVTQMQAIQSICNSDDYRVESGAGARTVIVVRVEDGHLLKGSPMVPVEALAVLKKDPEWVDISPEDDNEGLSEGVGTGDEVDSDPVSGGGSIDGGANNAPAAVKRSDKGVALDGAIAYREGTPAGDNPFSTEEDAPEGEYELAVAWDEAWDVAADEAAEDTDSKGGSVVNDRYRVKYAELGHPTHCGDWLAETLNNLCQTEKEGTDLGRFEAICEANGVDLSKYNRTTAGWQGRLRMTGRNLLAKRVYMAGGVLKTPIEGAEAEYKAPGDWMAGQRFKMPKSEQTKPIPEAAT